MITFVIVFNLSLMAVFLLSSSGGVRPYSMANIRQKLQEDYSLNDKLSRPGFSLNLSSMGRGKNTKSWVAFKITLTGLPEGFYLIQRGASSAALQAGGQISDTSGDEDFDGLFYCKGGLAPAQRGLLLDLWQLKPDFTIENRFLEGKIECVERPASLKKLFEILDGLQELQDKFPKAESYVRKMPQGSMREQRLGQEASWCTAAAFMLATLSISYLTVVGWNSQELPGYVCLLMLVDSVLFVRCASLIKQHSYAAVPILGWAQLAAVFSCIAVFALLFIYFSYSPLVMLLGLMSTVVIQYALSKARGTWRGLVDLPPDVNRVT